MRYSKKGAENSLSPNLLSLAGMICKDCGQPVKRCLVGAGGPLHLVEQTDLELKKEISRDFPGGPVAKTVLPMQGAWVRPLVRELDLICQLRTIKNCMLDFPGGSDSKESACNTGNLGSIPGRKDPP